ncbi:MAG: hypothetical protein ABIJ42_02750 [Acidobacteriota bacterium]
MKCIICNQRKGRRDCPALGGLICTQCCGSNRGIEIKCPDDCSYFGQAMGKKWYDLFHPAWSRIKDEKKRDLLLDSVNTCFPLIIFLQRGMLRTILGLTDPRDEFILEAIKLLEAGYSAGEKGIIYEPSSTNPNTQTIVREMREQIAREEKETRIPPEFLAESFRILVLFAENYTGEQTGEDSYAQLLRQFHPTVEVPEQKSGRIIITG